MAQSNDTFCWNGIVSSDPERTLAFFPEVLGWKVQKVEMGDETVSMLANGETPLAHVRGPQMEGEPTWWNNYLRVADVDAASKAVADNGGEVLVPPTDIPPGRFSTVKTPSGAAFSLFKSANPEDEDPVPALGNIHWVDLHSKDIDADLAFLREALGLKTQEMPMPNGPYFILNPDTATRGGAMAGMNPQAPSMWLAWVQVDSVEDVLGRVERNGGKVLAPAWNAEGVGHMAIASDPAGIPFGVIKPPAAN
ncbi:MAG: VOC family protein [Myxococcota bacterium]